jgi:hypothetical protein
MPMVILLNYFVDCDIPYALSTSVTESDEVPVTGKCFAGLFVFNPIPKHREYIQGTLFKPLAKNRKYCAQMFVSLVKEVA